MNGSKELVHHVHSYPDTVTESVKVERNSRGFTFEVKASTVKRAMEIYDEVRAQVDHRLNAEKG